MATIDTSIDIDLQFTIHTIKGEVLPEEISSKIKSYNGGRPTEFILWNFSGAVLKNITANHVGTFIELTKQYSNLKKRGKTAFVFSSDLGFGLGREFDIQLNIPESNISYMTFRSEELALKWLFERD